MIKIFKDEKMKNNSNLLKRGPQIKHGEFFFHTNGVSPSRQSEYFQDLVGPFYNLAFPIRRDGQFFSEERVWLIGEFTVFEARQDSYFKARDRFLPDRVPERLVISVCMASHGQTIVGEDSRHWAPGDVVISDGMPALKWHALQRTRELSIMLPRAVAAPGGGNIPNLLILDHRIPSARALRLQMGLVHDACRQGDKLLAHLLLSGFATVLANFLTGMPLEANHADIRTLRLNAILRYIDESVGDPALTPQFICKKFGLSRAALYRMFEPIGGVADHIRNRKLDVAYARILNLPRANENIGSVAGALGFYDHAHLSHRFKERFGLSPKDLMHLNAVERPSRKALCQTVRLPSSQPSFFDLITPAYG